MKRSSSPSWLPRLGVGIVAAAASLALVSRGEGVVLGWAARIARTGAPGERRSAIEKLRQLGDAGVPVLLVVALDPTPVPLESDPGWYSMLVPRDAAGDLALDALRHLRTGRPSPRALEWGEDYALALHEWRTKELDEALEWWEARRKAAAGGADPSSPSAPPAR